MKQLSLLTILLFCLNGFSQKTGQQNLNHCGTSDAMKTLYNSDSHAQKENEDFEKFTSAFVKEHLSAKTSTAVCYIIPVVFHVYGTTQGGKPVNNTIITNALARTNEDFLGLNPDFNTVHNSFLSIRGTMPDINFALAQKDPSGNPTNGIVYHNVTSGYGNGTGYDALIAADAWDNYKYMNIYVMNDLYNDNVTNNSGVAWYPNTTMSNNNTARIVYNGAYLGTNTSTEFASTLSHEFGHWLNLIHTFDGGCTSPNDYVSDTPPCDYGGASYTCHPSPSATTPVNCNNNLINAENYMDYCGAGGCYKMFTQGQTARMYAALLHPSRQPLWQMSNLVATGLSQLCLTTGLKNTTVTEHPFVIYPNPSSETIMISSNQKLAGSFYSITDLLGKVILAGKIDAENATISVDALVPGVYFFKISGMAQIQKIIKK